MTPKTFIFIGRSGCGKGTQASLLMDYIKQKDIEKRPIFYLETGQRFRDFIKSGSHSANLSNEVYKADIRQPDFLAVWMWSHLLIENLKGNEHLVIDGTPRSLQEAMVLETAIDFYKLEKPNVIYIDVGRKWSEERLLSRGRLDDASIVRIDKRLNWFDKDVVPALKFMKKSKKFNFIKINGEQTIGQVNQEIMNKLSKDNIF